MDYAVACPPFDEEPAMRQTELHLTDEDRELIESYRAKGLRHAREVNRAHILAALDHGIPEAQIMGVLGVGRTAIWRTRSAYLDGGVEYALCDVARPGKPRLYATDVEAKIAALACLEPPGGAKRWTLALLEQAAQGQAGMGSISRETIRRLLKKLPQAMAQSDAVHCSRPLKHHNTGPIWPQIGWLHLAATEMALCARKFTIAAVHAVNGGGPLGHRHGDIRDIIQDAVSNFSYSPSRSLGGLP
jgi:Homeodomain-like domain